MSDFAQPMESGRLGFEKQPSQINDQPRRQKGD